MNPVHLSRPPSSRVTGSDPAALFAPDEESKGLNRPVRDRGTPLVVGIASFVGMLVVGLAAVAILHRNGSAPAPITSPVLSFRPQVTAAGPIESTAPITPGSTVAVMATTASTTTAAPGSDPLTDSLFVAGPDGVYTVTPAGRTRIVDGSYQHAFDLAGTGVLVQAESTDRAEPKATSIYLIEPDQVPRLVLAPESNSDEWITLHDVIRRGGEWFALVSIRSGTGPADSSIAIRLVGVTSGSEISFGEMSGWEKSLGRLSIGNGFVVGQIDDSAGYSPLLLAVEGATPLEPGPFGLADSYDDCDLCPRAFAIDDTAERLAWIEGDRVVVVDIATKERKVFDLPEGSGRTVDSIEIGSTSLVLERRTSPGGPLQAAWVVTSDGRIATSPVIGFALHSTH